MLHGTAVGTDSGMAAELEDFIRQQKTKLAHDRATTKPRMSPRGRVESPPVESSNHHQGTPLRQAPQEVSFMAKMGTYEEQKRRLQDERKREYNEMLKKKNSSTGRPSGRVGGSGDAPSPRDSRPTRGAAARNHEGDAPAVLTPRTGQPLRGQHDMEYKHMLSGKSKRNERAYTPDDDRDYPRHRQTPPPDRTRHYNGSSGLPNPPRHNSRNVEPEFFATLPLRNHPSAQRRKEQERNREYNEFLRRGWHVSDAQAQADLRPRRDSMSDSDDEYQQFLQQRTPRRGWATPTYEETLEEKRRQERRYRDVSFQSFLKDLYSIWLDSHSRHDDPELYQPFELRNSVSDGHLDLSYDEDDQRLRLDDDRRRRGPYRDQDTKKVRFQNDKPMSRQNGRSQKEPEYTDLLSTLKPRHRTAGPADGEDSELLPNRRHDLNLVLSHKVALPPKAHNPQDDETYGTSLPIGHELSLSEQLRRKEEYREQLTRQIEQGKTKKNRVEQWVDAYRDHEIPYRKRAPQEWEKPAAGINSMKQQQQSQQMAMKVSQYPEAPSRLMDDLVRQPPERLPPTRGTNGILERGFEGLYEPLGKPAMTPTPQPVSLLNMPGVPGYANQLDQAYHYYGSKSLLDPSMPATAPPMSGPVGYTPQSTYPHDQPPTMPSQPTPRANYSDMSQREPTMTGQIGLGSDTSHHNQKEKQMSYQAELLKQIEEKKNKKLRQKQDEERYNMKMEEQLKIYDPFGKGGGGAPVRDADGNLVTNLRMMHLDNEEKWRDPSKFTGMQPVSPRIQVAPAVAPVISHQPATLTSPVAEGGPLQEQQYARGSSLMRILGDGMTEVQKSAQQKYQDDLRRQIEDKKRKQEEEKRQQQLEDERLMQKIEEENRKMQEQLEEEKRKERQKQEEAQKQQEQLKKAQEDRRKEVERARQEAEEKRQEEIRRKQEEDQQRRTDDRPLSPPLPANRSKTNPEKMVSEEQPGRKSPPVPAKRSSSRESRPPSAEVLNQLAHMRKQLLNERKRIEGDLKKTQDEPDVYDPRIYQRPTSKKNVQVDVFEVARTGEPVSLRRQGDVSTTNLREFNQLRNKEDTESRQNLRSMFPDEPMTSDALETQQRILLTEQEETLKKMAKRKSLMKRLDPHDLGLLREGSITSANMLESDSAFIAVSNGRHSGLNSGRADRPRQPASPSSGRRRRRQVETPDSIYTNPMGSVRSLDPESINSKNEERLRKLKALTGDDISVADPEDVLDRFMAKQQYKRPPSTQTLDDDTWLRPGTGTNG